jgi:hypothetical protein
MILCIIFLIEVYAAIASLQTPGLCGQTFEELKNNKQKVILSPVMCVLFVLYNYILVFNMSLYHCNLRIRFDLI